MAKIEQFATLPANWDSYGARPFIPRTIELAQEIASRLGPEWVTVPCADGPSVWLTRNGEDDIIEIHSFDESEPQDETK